MVWRGAILISRQCKERNMRLFLVRCVSLGEYRNECFIQAQGKDLFNE